MNPIVKTPRQVAEILQENLNYVFRLIEVEKDIRKVSLYSNIGCTLLDIVDALRKSDNNKEPKV